MNRDITPSHYTSREGLPIWQVLSRLVIALIVLIFLALVYLTFRPLFDRHSEEKQKIREIEIKVLNEQEIIRQKKKELDLLQANPEYVEIIARDKMDMMKEGEVIFRIESSSADSTGSSQP